MWEAMAVNLKAFLFLILVLCFAGGKGATEVGGMGATQPASQPLVGCVRMPK